MHLRPAALVCVALALFAAYLLVGRGEEHTNTGRLSGILQPRSPYSQQPVVVEVYEYGFHPGRVVILAGQTVAWKDVGKQFHVVTPDSRGGRRVWAAAKDAGSASHLFTKPGRYPYHCALHAQMHGVVVVKARS